MLLEFLTYGWPISATNPVELISTAHNHPSAVTFGGDIKHYLKTELGHGAILGPFQEPPIPSYHCSPLITCQKKGSAHRRIILDLSWPSGAALNDCIVEGEYMGEAKKMSSPHGGFHGELPLTAWARCVHVQNGPGLSI